ncbi:MAG: hypothetical protein ACO38Z_11180, partial [Candidatus Nanopelagicales bacterium]
MRRTAAILALAVVLSALGISAPAAAPATNATACQTASLPIPHASSPAARAPPAAATARGVARQRARATRCVLSGGGVAMPPPRPPR